MREDKPVGGGRGKRRRVGVGRKQGVPLPCGKKSLLSPISCKYLPRSESPGVVRVSSSLGTRPCSLSFVHIILYPYFILQFVPGLKLLTHWLLRLTMYTGPFSFLTPSVSLPRQPQPCSSLAFVLCWSSRDLSQVLFLPQQGLLMSLTILVSFQPTCPSTLSQALSFFSSASPGHSFLPRLTGSYAPRAHT